MSPDHTTELTTPDFSGLKIPDLSKLRPPRLRNPRTTLAMTIFEALRVSAGNVDLENLEGRVIVAKNRQALIEALLTTPDTPPPVRTLFVSGDSSDSRAAAAALRMNYFDSAGSVGFWDEAGPDDAYLVTSPHPISIADQGQIFPQGDESHRSFIQSWTPYHFSRLDTAHAGRAGSTRPDPNDQALLIVDQSYAPLNLMGDYQRRWTPERPGLADVVSRTPLIAEVLASARPYSYALGGPERLEYTGNWAMVMDLTQSLPIRGPAVAICNDAPVAERAQRVHDRTHGPIHDGAIGELVQQLAYLHNNGTINELHGIIRVNLETYTSLFDGLPLVTTNESLATAFRGQIAERGLLSRDLFEHLRVNFGLPWQHSHKLNRNGRAHNNGALPFNEKYDDALVEHAQDMLQSLVNDLPRLAGVRLGGRQLMVAERETPQRFLDRIQHDAGFDSPTAMATRLDLAPHFTITADLRQPVAKFSDAIDQLTRTFYGPDNLLFRLTEQPELAASILQQTATKRSHSATRTRPQPSPTSPTNGPRSNHQENYVKTVHVIGAGIMGVTIADALCDLRQNTNTNFKIIVHESERLGFDQHGASSMQNISTTAGAQFIAFGTLPPKDDIPTFMRWLGRAHRFYDSLARDQKQTGVTRASCNEETDVGDSWPAHFAATMRIHGADVSAGDTQINLSHPRRRINPGPEHDFASFTINTPQTLGYFHRRLIKRGVIFQHDSVDREDLTKMNDVVFVAAGMGAVDLLGEEVGEFRPGHSRRYRAPEGSRRDQQRTHNDLIALVRSDGTLVVAGNGDLEERALPLLRGIIPKTQMPSAFSQFIDEAWTYRVVPEKVMETRPDPVFPQVRHFLGSAGCGWTLGPGFSPSYVEEEMRTFGIDAPIDKTLLRPEGLHLF